MPPLPRPEPGLVLHYEFLWSHEIEPEKRRPCVVLATETFGGRTIVTIVPTTTKEPKNPDAAIKVPPKVKEALGLDSGPSWFILSELNEFDWPGRHIHYVPRRWNHLHYGYLPPALFKIVKGAVLALDARKKKVMKRSG